MARKEKQGIGKRIEELRKRKELTQDELAKALNMTRSNLNMWELGERELKARDLQDIADYFGVTTDYLIYGRETQNIDIYRATGLSQSAIETLRKFKDSDIALGSTESAGKCDALSKALSNSDLLNVLTSLMLVQQGESGYYESSYLSSDRNFYNVECSPDSFSAFLSFRLQLIIHAIRTGDQSIFASYAPANQRPKDFAKRYGRQNSIERLKKQLNALEQEEATCEEEGAQDGKESK